ncbi:MAG: hypothetical protein HQL45_10710 [Alphaproteobacteria bacterium]|nr:hypothetical protein [Alphaproteobacteria bacterium]
MTLLVRDNHYFLIEAFQLLGKRLFGPEWQGDEWKAEKLDAPDVVVAKRTPLEAELSESDRQIAQIEDAISKNVKADKIENLKQEKRGLLARQQDIHKALRNLYVPDKCYQSRYAAFVRRHETEARLSEALRTDSIPSRILGGIILNGSHWQSRAGYRHMIDLSLIVLPRLVYSKRRGTVLVPMAECGAWLETLMPIVVDPEAPPSPEFQCVEFLRQIFAKGEPYPYSTKLQYLEAATRKFPGLSKRAFDRVWGNHAPDSQKKRGRK